MTWAVTADPDKFEEAVAWFLSRLPLTAAQANGLDADTQERAFWIGGGLQFAQVQAVFDEIGKAIESGEPFEDWRKRVREQLIDDAHAETVFRNAVQRSYNVGRHQQMTEPEVLKFRPFWMYDAVLDSRTTEICRERDGVVLAQDDPWWQRNYPPLHMRCRAGVRSLRRAEAERRGIRPAPPADGDVPDGWGLAPGAQEVWRPDAAKHDRELATELDRKATVRTAPVPTLPGLLTKKENDG